jgi:hypothetical protein
MWQSRSAAHDHIIVDGGCESEKPGVDLEISGVGAKADFVVDLTKRCDADPSARVI